MRKILQGILVVAGVFMCMGMASAQTTVYNFFLSDQNNLSNPGGYNVQVTQTGDMFVVNSITGTANNTDTAQATELTMTFYSTYGGNIPGKIPETGTTDTVGLGTGAGVFVGALQTENWTFSAGVSKLISNGDTVNDIGLDPNGANTYEFTTGSYITVLPSARSFNMNLQDGDQFAANIDLTPEASSWMLLLAAIAPFGLLAWRRRAVPARPIG